MSVNSDSKKKTVKFRTVAPEEVFRKNQLKAKAARTERPPANFGAAEMGFGAESMKENDMKKIRIIREQAGSKVNDAAKILDKIDFAVNPAIMPGSSAGAFDAGEGYRNALRIEELEDLKLSGAEIAAAIEQSNHDISRLASKIGTALKKAKVGKKKVKNQDIFDRFLAMVNDAEAQKAGTTKSKTAFTQTVVSEPEKLLSLKIDVSKKRHRRGDAVKAVQLALINQQIKVEADGAFGPKTRAAIKKFQERVNLKADGIAGPNTLRKLAGRVERQDIARPLRQMIKAGIIVGARGGKAAKKAKSKAEPKAPEAPGTERGVGDTDTPGDEPKEPEQRRRPVERKSRPLRLDLAGKRWVVYADFAIANDGERIPTRGSGGILDMASATGTSDSSVYRRVNSALSGARLPNAPVNESLQFQVTLGQLKQIINEEIQGIEALNEVDNTPDVSGFTKVPVHKKASASTRSKLPSINDEEIVYVKADSEGLPANEDNPHGELQFPDDPYTYNEVGEDYIIVSGPRPGAIGKTIRKDATSPRMKKAHALLDKRLGKAPEVAIGAPASGEPEMKDAEGAEKITAGEAKKIASITYGKMKKAVDRVRPAAEEIDSAVEGFTTDADLYIIWREVKKAIASDDEGLFNTKMLNGLYAADYPGSSLHAPALTAAMTVGVIAAVVFSGGTLAPWALALAGSLGSAGVVGGAALTGAAIIGVAQGVIELLEDDPATAGAAANLKSTALADEVYGEVDPTTGKPAEIAMEAVRDVMTGIARGTITDKQTALSMMEAPLKAEEVLDIVENG